MKYENFAKGTLTDQLLEAGESLTITTTETFPQDGEFIAVIWDAGISEPQDDTTREIVKLVWDTDHYDVTRAQEDTVAKLWAAGSYIGHVVTAAQIAKLENIQDYSDSPMIVTGGVITEGTNAGTFKVTALTALLRATDSSTGELVEVSLSEQDNQAITLADTTYIVALNYNSGSPTISIGITNPYDADKRNIPIGKVGKDGSDNVHYLSGGYSLQDGVRKLHERSRILRELELDGGSTIAYSGTNNFTMTAGIVYSGINKFVLDEYDSAVTTFIPVYQDGVGGWTYGAPRNTIDYAKYDDGDGTLGNIGISKYGNHWVYRHIDDGDVYVLYGRGSYALATAEAAGEPTKPDHLTDFGILVGKIIAPQAGGSFTVIQMVSDTFFAGTAVADHAQLGNLQGGAASEYYHLTVAEHTIVGNTSGANTGDNAANPSCLPITGGTMSGDIQLGETDIKLDAVLSGDEKWSGITVAGTAGSAIAVGDICYLASSGKWLLVDGILDGTDTGFSKQLGMCVLAAGADTNPTEMLVYGKIRSATLPALTVGSAVYLSDTAGDLVVAQPTTTNFAIRVVGYAITAEDLFFNPSNDYVVHI